MSSTTSPISTTELQAWLNRAIEFLWLLTVFLVPLAFLDRDFAKSETIIAYVEVPKVALLRTMVGLMAVLWLIDWGLHGTLSGSSFRHKTLQFLLAKWLALLGNAMRGHPRRWLLLAVGFYLGTTILSTVLSGSLQTSIWGEVPGQDGYPAYTVAAYVLLFTVIATHLKTRPQLWRLLGAIVAMGVLISGYTVLQHYGHDFLNLGEPTGGRVTAFMGNRIFAAAVMLMTIPITAAAVVIALFNLPEKPRPTPNPLFPRLPALAVLAAGALALAVQFLGLIFTLSRGPWIGTLFALVSMVVLVWVFVGRGGMARLSLVLGLAGVIAFAVLLNPSFKSELDSGSEEAPDSISASVDPAISSAAVGDQTLPASSIDGSASQPEVDTKPPETSRNISVAVDPTASAAWQRLNSIKEVVTGGLTGGRQTHWKVSWILIQDRPWFAFDSLSLRWLRPVVGYGPDLFRYTYLLESPPEGPNLFPLEPDHAHNYFIHQTVEQGFLGALSSMGIFAAVFLASAYQLLRFHKEMEPLHKLLLITLMSVLAGRALEMMVGIARISDLTVLWVLLGMFAALPVAVRSTEPAPQRIRSSRSRQRPSATRPASAPDNEVNRNQRLWKLALATWLIGMILVLTWMKGISYPLAAVQIGNALGYSRQGDLPSTLEAINRAIELAPDVPVYYNWRASVYKAYRGDSQIPRERRCDFQKDVSYQLCLAALTHESNLAGINQRPFYYRSRIAAAVSAFNLRLDDESIRYYRESLNLVPGSWALWDNLASALIQQGRPGEALGPLQESLEITKGTNTTIGALNLRAKAYVDLGRHLDAINDLDRVLETSPDNAQAHASRALAYTNLGQDALASEDAARAVDLGADPNALDRAVEQIKKSR